MDPQKSHAAIQESLSALTYEQLVEINKGVKTLNRLLQAKSTVTARRFALARIRNPIRIKCGDSVTVKAVGDQGEGSCYKFSCNSVQAGQDSAKNDAETDAKQKADDAVTAKARRVVCEDGCEPVVGTPTSTIFYSEAGPTASHTVGCTFTWKANAKGTLKITCSPKKV